MGVKDENFTVGRRLVLGRDLRHQWGGLVGVEETADLH